MYIMSTNAEYAEMTIAKLLVKATARNQRCLERMPDELKSIFYIFIIQGTEVQYKFPVKAFARNLCCLKCMQYDPSKYDS